MYKCRRVDEFIIFLSSFILMMKLSLQVAVLLVFPHSIVISYFPFPGTIFPQSFLSQSPERYNNKDT